MSANTISDSIECVLKFKKLSNHAYTPTKATNLSSGFILYSAYDYVVVAGEKELVLSDLQIELPSGCYGRIAPQFRLAWHAHLDIGAGVIDRDYRGNVGIVVFNLSDRAFTIKKGDPVAQLICQKIFYPKLVELVEDQTLSGTDRGDLGFGSTGVEIKQNPPPIQQEDISSLDDDDDDDDDDSNAIDLSQK